MKREEDRQDDSQSFEQCSVAVMGECLSSQIVGLNKREGSEQLRKQTSFEDNLRVKFQRLKQFIDRLDGLRDTPINPQMFQQLQIEEEVYRNVDHETIIYQTEKRIEKMIKTRKLKRNWSVCDLKILIWLIGKYCEKQQVGVADLHNEDESWRFISSLIPGTTADSCLFKWLSLKRHKITLHNWSQEEEKILMELEKKHAQSRNKWKFISQQLYALNQHGDKIYRHPKQCRQHYASFLDPNIKKGPWCLKEDLTLLQHILQHGGQKKWCKLVRILEGRTENAIKNRFQLLFSKMRKKKENKSKGEVELVAQYVREKGGVVPTVKKQREAVKNEEKAPPTQPHIKIQQQPKIIHPRPPPPRQPIIPLIPTPLLFSSRSLPSAFQPFDMASAMFGPRMFIQMPGRHVVSMSSIPHPFPPGSPQRPQTRKK